VPSEETVDFVVPVFNEGENIERTLTELSTRISFPRRILVVYDFELDTTLPVVRRMMRQMEGLELVRNDQGQGVLNAIRTGIRTATGDIVIVTMADLSDDVNVVPEMVHLIREEGYDVVCASRYMRGGRHIGGPLLKRTLSRMAGLTLYALGALPVHDATNAFPRLSAERSP
jgi:dolichol-phosphate mannosyltransferase